jgi:hypothetical protein
MFAPLSPGQHTIRYDFNSSLFGGDFSTTLHITVVPEPSTIAMVACGAIGLLGTARRRCIHEVPLDYV